MWPRAYWLKSRVHFDNEVHLGKMNKKMHLAKMNKKVHLAKMHPYVGIRKNHMDQIKKNKKVHLAEMHFLFFFLSWPFCTIISN